MSKLFVSGVFYYSCSNRVYGTFRGGPNAWCKNSSLALRIEFTCTSRARSFAAAQSLPRASAKG